MTTQEQRAQAAQFAAAGRAALAARRHAEAASMLRRAISLDPSDASLHNDLGRAFNNLRRFARAEQAFRDSIRLAPHDAEAYCNLGHVLRAQAQLEAAAAAFSEARQLDPGLARAWRGLATTLALSGELIESTSCLRRALEIEPGDVETLLNLAGVLERRGLLREAVAVYTDACALAPGNAHAHVRLADLYQSLSDFDAALRHYGRALRADPGDQIALAGAAFVHERRGEYEQGWRLLADIVEQGRPGPDVLHAAARLLRRLGRHAQALQLLQPLCTDAAQGWSRRPQLYFTLGEIHDELGDAAAAFECFRQANALAPPAHFDPHAHCRRVDDLIGFFGSAQAQAITAAAPHRPQLVFIVGMPRSGTSLVEQILASHPLVHAGGERQEIPRLAHQLSLACSESQPYPAGLAALDPAAIAAAAQRYRQSYGAVADGVICATDKLPVNFLELGLIELMFPNARVIHCQRHPLDIMLSIYFQNFHPESQPFATRLEHIAVFYEQYERLMSHWREVLRLPLLEIRYERLVEQQEPVTRALLEFLDLPWHARCLKFFETSRDVGTSSYAQVRRPIYSSSVHRHKRYLRELGELAQRFAARGAD